MNRLKKIYFYHLQLLVHEHMELKKMIENYYFQKVENIVKKKLYTQF